MFRKITTLALLVLLPWFGTPKAVFSQSSEARLPGAQPYFIPLRSMVSFDVHDFQPRIDRTGPMNWIARNPGNSREVFASSITGGLWRSSDGGNNWEPVRSLQPWSVSAVAYLFDGTTGGAILVTTREDFRVDSGAGVWRSNDHGDSWTRLAQVPTGCGDVPRAHGIAVRDTNVYVATSCGLLRSRDGWTFAKVPVSAFSPAGALSGPNAEHFYSVEFTRSGALLAGGEAGFFWQMGAASGPSGSVLGMKGNNGEMRRAFAVTPSRIHPNIVLGLSGGPGYERMMISQDDGRSWRPVPSSPGPHSAGGSPFVRIVPTAVGSDDVFVYYGNTWGWYRSGPFRNGDLSSLATDAHIPWPQLTIGHPDPHDVDFKSLPGEGLDRRAMLLATDGGLEICSFGADPNDAPFCNEGGVIGTDRGLSAIQVMNVKGQIIGDGYGAERHLYIVTWHTDSQASDGRSWRRSAGEATSLEMERHIESTTQSQIFYNESPHRLANDLMTDNVVLRDVPGTPGPPVLLQRGVIVETASGPTATFLYAAANVSRDTAARTDWILMTNYQTCDSGGCSPIMTSDAPVFAGYTYSEGIEALLYQPYQEKLAVVRGIVTRLGGDPRLTSGVVTYPQMKWIEPGHVEHDVRIGIRWTPFTGFGQYPVVGTDRLYPFHVLIPDIQNDQVMRSTDGGDTWTPITGLADALMKDPRSGPASRRIFEFKLNRGSGFQSIVSSISLFPEDPNLVMLGTVENGLFFSQDRGTTWQHVPNTEHITNVVALYWCSANSVIVGSWGRGLFEVTMRYTVPRSIFDAICHSCSYAPVSGLAMEDFPRLIPIAAQSGSDLAQPNFDEALLVLDGRINGVEMKQGRIQKVWRTVGSSEYRFGSPKSQLTFVTEEQTGFMGFKDLPIAEELRSQGQVVKGLAFTNGRLTYVIYGSQQTSIPAPAPLGRVSFPKETNPHLKEPYLRIFGPGMVLTTIDGKQPFDLQGYLFQSNTPLELRVDGKVQSQLRTDATGQFATRLVAPSSIGPHLIVARQSIGNRIVQAVIGFSVNNSDSK